MTVSVSAEIAMSKLFVFVCAIPLILSANALAQPQDEPLPERTLWDHNGSIMYLVANASSREFYYRKPRPGMLEAGAHPDDLLFKGQMNDGQISGIAYIFNAQCGRVPFHVKGPVLDNGGKIVLTGQAPRVGRNCQTTGEYTSTLEFKLLKTSEVAQPLGDGSGVGSPTFGVLPGNKPSAQTPPTAPPPRIEQPKSEAEKPNDTKTAAAPLPQPSQGSMHPTATQGFMNKSLAPVIIALNVALPLLSILFLVVMLKSTARGY